MQVRYLPAALLVAACLTAGGQSAGVSAPPLRTLATAREVHGFPVDEASRAYPVHLHAVVTYYDPYIDSRHGALFVCDSSGCVFVAVPYRPILPIDPGDAVDILGVTGPGDYAPVVISSQVQFAAKSHLPENPPKITLPRLLTGILDCEWVELEGRVRNVHLQPQNVVLEIAAEGGRFVAISLREPGANYDALIDSRVRIRANVAPLFNQNRQMVGAHAFFPSLKELTVIEAAPHDPFSQPAIPISQLFRFSPTEQILHRVHIQGTVTLSWPGRLLCIQDGKDGLCVETAQPAGAEVGSLVDVVGFPAILQFKPGLEDATFRVTGQTPAPAPRPISPNDALKSGLGGQMVQIGPAPRPISPNDALKSEFDGQVVEIDAELVGQNLAASDPTLILHAGQLLFSASLPKDAVAAAAQWKPGSLLRVTGVSTVQVDTLGTSVGEGSVRTQSLHLLLRTAGDVAVLSAPSWWTPSHALESFAMVGILVLAAFVWVAVLRHQVEQKTVALRDSEERLRHLSEHDALTGLPNRLLLSDRLNTSFQRAERSETCLGLLLIDLDEFKEVNDAFGHQAGDDVLCELSRRLSACVRSTDTVARMGGDEFIALLPDMRVSVEAEMIAAKLIVAAAAPIAIDEGQVTVTVSIGVATYPQSGADVESLLRAADEAMYAAKEKGKNRYQVARAKTVGFGGAREQVLHPAPIQTSGA